MKELFFLITQNIHSFEKTMNFRKGQKPFYDAIIEGLMKGWRTMYIEGPTGMGKTFIEAVVAAAVIGDSDTKVLLLTSKITLLQQIQREFKKFVGFLGTGLFGGGFKNYNEQVTIMTYASYQRQTEEFIKQFKILLLDEGHKGLGKKTKEQLELQKEFSILIGFTASSEYSSKKSLEMFLVNRAYKLSIIEAVELSMLSNIKVIIASVDIEIESQYDGESRSEYKDRISAEIIREGGNIATARLYKRIFAKRNLRGITLVLTTTQGNDLVDEFEKENIKAELIHSGLKRTDREDMFIRFRNNEFQVLVGMGIIKEGFDDPGVSVAITTYPVNSRVDMTQFPGRAERIDEDNPDKIAYIVNLAYQSKKQLFYADILEGKSEILQKKKRKKKLDIISSFEIQSAIAKKPDSFITSVAVEHQEVMDITRRNDPISYYHSLTREKQLETLKAELAKHEVTSYFELISLGSVSFTKKTFDIFGKGTSFAGYILLKTVKKVKLSILKEVAKKFDWKIMAKTLENAKAELGKHGIVDRVSLMSVGHVAFVDLGFGVFGSSYMFGRFVLSRKVKYISKSLLEEIAEKFDWNDKAKTLENAKRELAKHGIVNRVSLMKIGPTKFTKLDFGIFGKGSLLVRFIIPDMGNHITNLYLKKVARKFNWYDTREVNLEDIKIELAKHGIINRVSLMKVGTTKFINMEFGSYGKGYSFARFIFPKRSDRITKSFLEELSKELEWFDTINILEDIKTELAKHGIVNRVSLMKIGPTKFTKLDFGIFGKGISIAGLILTRRLKRVSFSVFEEMAKKMKWQDREKTLERAKYEMKKHRIVDKSSLMKVGPTAATRLDFGPFGKGKAMGSFILSRAIDDLSVLIFEEIAEKFGW